MILQVVGDMTDAAACIQQLLGQQGTCGSTCKVLQVQPGREALVAAAALAPILLGEAILGLLQPGNAGKHTLFTLCLSSTSACQVII